jgi:Fe-S-cluster-containing dehydrogenase component
MEKMIVVDYDKCIGCRTCEFDFIMHNERNRYNAFRLSKNDFLRKTPFQ